MGFGIGFGFDLGRWRPLGGPKSGPTITAPGTLDVDTFRIGTSHTVSVGQAVPSGGGSVSYESRWIVGPAELPQASYTPKAPDDGLAIAAQWRAVETGGSNDGASFWQTAGAGNVSYAPPSLSASHDLVGRVLNITLDSVSEEASAALTALELEGANVLSEVVGSGPWSYAVPSSLGAAQVDWTVEATNSGGSATVNGSVTVPADLMAPAALGGLDDLSVAIGSPIEPLDAAQDFSGTAPISYALASTSAALPPGLALSSNGVITGTPTAIVSRTILIRGTNGYGADETGFLLTVTAAQAWNIAGGTNEIGVFAAPTILAPTASGGAGEISFTE